MPKIVVSEYLDSPPPVLWGFTTDCDDALAEAAGRLGVDVVSVRTYGLAGKSAGATVADRHSKRRWLRVTGLVGRRINERRRAEIEAESLVDLPKPDVHRAIEWERDGVHWRAVLSALAPSPTPSENCWLVPGTVPPPARWFRDLRASLDRLQQQARPVNFVKTDEQIRVGIRGIFGPDAPSAVTEWCASHGDLHWKNLTVPNLTLLDWENWGLAPRAYDVARLMVYAAHVPAVQVKLYETFADDFDSATGLVALMLALGMVKSDVADGTADAALGPPLDRMAKTLLAGRRVRACFR